MTDAHFHSWMAPAEAIPDEERAIHLHAEHDKHGAPVLAFYRTGQDPGTHRPRLRLRPDEAAALALDLLAVLTPDDQTETNPSETP